MTFDRNYRVDSVEEASYTGVAHYYSVTFDFLIFPYISVYASPCSRLLLAFGRDQDLFGRLQQTGKNVGLGLQPGCASCSP